MAKDDVKYEVPTGPVTKAVGLVRGKDGWRAVFLKVQGRTVLSYSNLCEDSTKSEAIEHIKIAVARRLIPSDA